MSAPSVAASGVGAEGGEGRAAIVRTYHCHAEQSINEADILNCG